MRLGRVAKAVHHSIRQLGCISRDSRRCQAYCKSPPYQKGAELRADEFSKIINQNRVWIQIAFWWERKLLRHKNKQCHFMMENHSITCQKCMQNNALDKLNAFRTYLLLIAGAHIQHSGGVASYSRGRFSGVPALRLTSNCSSRMETHTAHRKSIARFQNKSPALVTQPSNAVECILKCTSLKLRDASWQLPPGIMTTK